jgi:hypothetical protein
LIPNSGTIFLEDKNFDKILQLNNQ